MMDKRGSAGLMQIKRQDNGKLGGKDQRGDLSYAPPVLGMDSLTAMRLLATLLHPLA